MWSKKKKILASHRHISLGNFHKSYYRQILSAFLKFYMAFMEGVDVRLAWRRIMTKILGNVV